MLCHFEDEDCLSPCVKLVGLVSTSPYRKESLLEASSNKIEDKEQAEAESLDAKMQIPGPWSVWQNVEALMNKMEEKEQAEAMQDISWIRFHWQNVEALLNKMEEKEQAEAESLDAKMQLVRRG